MEFAAKGLSGLYCYHVLHTDITSNCLPLVTVRLNVCPTLQKLPLQLIGILDNGESSRPTRVHSLIVSPVVPNHYIQE